jgi:hypothetical protein
LVCLGLGFRVLVCLGCLHVLACTSESSFLKRHLNSSHSYARNQRRSSSVRQYARRSTKCDTWSFQAPLRLLLRLPVCRCLSTSSFTMACSSVGKQPLSQRLLPALSECQRKALPPPPPLRLRSGSPLKGLVCLALRQEAAEPERRVKAR